MKNVGLSLLLLAAGWLAQFATVHAPAALLWQELGLIFVWIAVTVAASFVEAGLARFVAAASSTYALASFGAHLIWGTQSVQGRAAHFAVLFAAFVGVGMGMLSASAKGHRPLTLRKTGIPGAASEVSGVR